PHRRRQDSRYSPVVPGSFSSGSFLTRLRRTSFAKIKWLFPVPEDLIASPPKQCCVCAVVLVCTCSFARGDALGACISLPWVVFVGGNLLWLVVRRVCLCACCT
ncbi:unnamed protein product, partial [Ectocarpus sp. 12 AP-2014]